MHDRIVKAIENELVSDGLESHADCRLSAGRCSRSLRQRLASGHPTANPWRYLEGFVTRQNPDGEFPGEVLGEPISLEYAIKIMTINGAITLEHDDITGSIETGKYADMIVLDANPFDLVEAGQTDRIGDMNVTKTLFEGEVVFEASD